MNRPEPHSTPLVPREHPWHERRVGTKQFQWFGRLGALHRLTSAWSSEIGGQSREGRGEHELTRGLSGRVAENLWMLDLLRSEKIEPLLDDTTPEDVLARLEHTAWSVQAWTFLRARDLTPDAERPMLLALLEQVAWREGRRQAAQAWPNASAAAGGLAADPREVVLALSTQLLSVNPAGDPFLLRRATAGEVHLELHACPHRSPYGEVAPAADALCSLHAQWMKGFAYALDARSTLEHHRGDGSGVRCRQTWRLIA